MDYDDGSRSDLPLIVLHDGGAASVTARTALGRSARVTGALNSIDAYTVVEPKSKAGATWKSLTAAGPQERRTLAPGLAYIRLDGRVTAVPDRSVFQTGAPAAWNAGLTGRGVTTAVLDTGIDATHPDLSDAVIESKDFTRSPNGTQDGNGHGTQVASIITGTGTGRAFGGRYRDVAPDTRLLVGEVLEDSGGGAESSIIEGVEWAAARGARVISMSLGADATDGTDLMAQAVNKITGRSDAPFVIAAGNSGRTSDVNTPASANATLAVGAVDADDALARFSSRGPRVGDNTVKPEITTPGVEIVAARDRYRGGARGRRAPCPPGRDLHGHAARRGSGGHLAQ
ncbi:S8 family peptidase [Streptomyces sp. NPDC055607]